MLLHTLQITNHGKPMCDVPGFATSRFCIYFYTAKQTSKIYWLQKRLILIYTHLGQGRTELGGCDTIGCVRFDDKTSDNRIKIEKMRSEGKFIGNGR